MKKNWQKQGSPYQLTEVQNGQATAGGVQIGAASMPDGPAVAVKAAGQIIFIRTAAEK